MQFAQTLPTEKDKRTLREIQEEEQARQAENDFLKWWAEEEARTKRDADGSAAPAEKKKRKPRKPKEPTEPVGPPGSSSSSGQAGANASPATPDRPRQPRKTPHPQANDAIKPRSDGQVESNSHPAPNGQSRGGNASRSRGLFRGRGTHPRPVPQAI
jgi:hypothetical protein